MAKRKLRLTTNTRPGKVTKETSGSNKISNVGHLVKRLQRYPPDAPFNTVDHDVLQDMFCDLRAIFNTPRPKRNVEKIRAIDGCYLDNLIFRQFPTWTQNPAAFWEPTPEAAVPSYLDLSEPRARLRAFFASALALEFELSTRQIRWRFVTIAAYNHFARRYPNSKLRPDKVRDYLKEVGLEASDAHVSRCHAIITSGKRRTEFCRKLQDVSAEHAQTEGGSFVNYGPMFMSSLPDDLWDNKNGYTKSTLDDCVAYLRSLKAGAWTTDVGCESLAKRLIVYHNELIWPDTTHQSAKITQTATYQSSGNALNGSALPQAADPMSTQVGATANLPWQSLLTAAELLATQPVPAMIQPPALTPLADTEPLEGDRDTTAGIIPLPFSSSHAEEQSSAIPANGVNTATNEAVFIDDFTWLWDPAAPLCQDPSFYALDDNSLLPNRGDSQQW